MRFTWDPRKSDENRRLRGFDFAFAARIFEEFVVRRPDSRRDYGESRIVAIGMADGREWTVVYTERTNSIGELEYRIISARRSNIKERLTYAEELAEKT